MVKLKKNSTVKKGMLSLVSAPKKKLVTTTPAFKRAAGGWLGVAIEQRYADRRPLFGDIRPISKGWTPNSMGKDCDRETILGVLGYQFRIESKLRRIFDMGNAIEAMWIKRFQEMGCYVDSGTRVTRAEAPTLSGKLDIRVRHPFEPGCLIIVEVKSINANGFRQLPAVTLDPEENFNALLRMTGSVGSRIRGYLVQLQSYLKEDGNPEGMLLFENKDNQEYADYFIVLNEEFIQEQYDRLNRLSEYRERLVVPACNCKGKGDLCKIKQHEEIELEKFKEIVHEGMKF